RAAVVRKGTARPPVARGDASESRGARLHADECACTTRCSRTPRRRGRILLTRAIRLATGIANGSRGWKNSIETCEVIRRMRMRHSRLITVAVVLLAVLGAAQAGAADIKVATVLPENTQWMKDMRAGA